MKLLVTGLSGFTGHHLADKAQQAGWQVVGFDADLTDAQSVQKTIDGHAPDAVLHLAGISLLTHVDSAELYRINTVGTTTLLQALVNTPKQPEKVVLASSASVYGHCTSLPVNETQVPAPVNHYAASKVAMEHLAHTYDARLPVVITRPFNYTGPGQDARFLVPKLIEHFVCQRASINLGNLSVRREINDVRLVCDAYVKLLQVGVPGQTYNICTGVSYQIHDLLAVLSGLTNHCPTVLLDPSLLRPDELPALYGDPTHLNETVGQLPCYSLDQTLQWMLECARSGHG